MTIIDEQLMILVVVLIVGYYLYNRYEGFTIGGRRKGKHHHRHWAARLDHSFGHPFGNYPYEYQEPVYRVLDNWNRRNRWRVERYDENLYNRNQRRLRRYNENPYNRYYGYNENRYLNRDYENPFRRGYY